MVYTVVSPGVEHKRFNVFRGLGSGSHIEKPFHQSRVHQQHVHQHQTRFGGEGGQNVDLLPSTEPRLELRALSVDTLSAFRRV